MNPLNTQRILSRQRRDDTHPEPAKDGNRLQIGLDSRPAAGVRSGNGQHPYCLHDPSSRGNRPALTYLTPSRYPDPTVMTPFAEVKRLLIP